MTTVFDERVRQLESDPSWLVRDDESYSAQQRAGLLAAMSPEQRRGFDEWLHSLSPDPCFEALGYVPFDRQRALHSIPAWSEGGPFDVLYGGAAGPGKSLGLLMDGIAWAWRFRNLEVWAIRATYPELRDSFLMELETRLNYCKAIGARWLKGERTLTLPNASRVKFRHARNPEDAAQLLSASCQLLVIDERTRLQPVVVERLASRVRSGDPRVPVVGVRSGSNPGGIGHGALKASHIDPAPLGNERIEVRLPSGKRADRFYLPGLPGDNPHLDVDYYDRLSLLSEDIQNAYRHGDWEKFEGMAFGEWKTSVHVVRPDEFPLVGVQRRAIGIDYGNVAPFCALWLARLGDNTVVVYRELYRTDLTPEEQAELILRTEAEGERRSPTDPQAYLDPSTWARGPDSPKPSVAGSAPARSIAGRYQETGLRVRQANNDRLGGKALVHAGLKIRSDGRPRLYVYSNCVNLIRTLPTLVLDDKRPEDVDTTQEDHGYDALRYGLNGLAGRTGRVRTSGDVQRNTTVSVGTP